MTDKTIKSMEREADLWNNLNSEVKNWIGGTVLWYITEYFDTGAVSQIPDFLASVVKRVATQYVNDVTEGYEEEK